MNKYFKNFILCGDVDYYCILCEENFQGIADVDTHIRWEKHRKSLKGHTYFPKCKKDFIYKLENNYYCEACNCLLADLTFVTSHIKEDAHKTNKKTPVSDKDIENTLCSYDSGYVIVSDIIVSDQQWHCIVNRMCLLCSTRCNIEEAKSHINTTTHVLNVIRSKILKHKEGYYRKVNDEIFYCFTCKSIVPYEVFDAHWVGREHCLNRTAAISRITTSNTEQEKKKELARKLIETQRAYFHIDEAKTTATCKDCKLTVNLEFKTMLDHQKSHGSKKKLEEPISEHVYGSSDEEEVEKVVYCAVQDHGKKRSELSKFGKENYIRLNAGGSRGYCGLCHSNLSASMRVFKEHIRGSRHRGHLELKGVKSKKEHKNPKIKSVPLVNYVNSLYYSRSMRVLWINKDICLDVPGFILVSTIKHQRNYPKMKCFACDVEYPTGTDLMHYQTEEHKRRLLAAKVFEIPNELIREIRPDVYHCGCCSKVFPFWEQMEKHLNTFQHVHRKRNTIVVQRLISQWFNDNVLVRSSENPDIFVTGVMGGNKLLVPTVLKENFKGLASNKCAPKYILKAESRGVFLCLSVCATLAFCYCCYKFFDCIVKV